MSVNQSWYNKGGIVETNEWYTPPEIFKKLNTTFDLDVAAPKGGVPWIPATDHYYKEIDGLKQDWQGFVWCNPPYGSNTAIWLKKFIEHNNGIALVFSRTDTLWFHDYCTQADILTFYINRIKFINKGKQAKKGVTGSIFVGCGKNAVKILEQANLGYNVHKR